MLASTRQINYLSECESRGEALACRESASTPLPRVFPKPLPHGKLREPPLPPSLFPTAPSDSPFKDPEQPRSSAVRVSFDAAQSLRPGEKPYENQSNVRGFRPPRFTTALVYFACSCSSFPRLCHIRETRQPIYIYIHKNIKI